MKEGTYRVIWLSHSLDFPNYRAAATFADSLKTAWIIDVFRYGCWQPVSAMPDNH